MFILIVPIFGRKKLLPEKVVPLTALVALASPHIFILQRYLMPTLADSASWFHVVLNVLYELVELYGKFLRVCKSVFIVLALSLIIDDDVSVGISIKSEAASLFIGELYVIFDVLHRCTL
jgi:hypothetical protein